jgi:hypothetical protein
VSTTDQVLRRHYIAIATDLFDAFPPLDVAREVKTVRDWVTDAALADRQFTDAGYEELAHCPSYDQIRARLAGTALFSGADAVILYVTGHGMTEENRHWVVLHDSEPGALARTAVATSDLIRWLASYKDLMHVVILIDLCQAGGVANDLSAALLQDLPREWVVLLTTPVGVDAKVGAFTGVLDAVLAEFRDGTVKDSNDVEPYLPSHLLIAHLAERLWEAHRQDLVTLRIAYRPNVCLPNPRFDPSRLATVATTTARRDLAVLQSDLDRYWTERAPVVADHGAVFTGRRQLMTRLINFAAGSPGTLVIAGRAGCGKSAALARLVTCSDELFRERYADILAAAEPVPPEGAVDVAVLATGKTQDQIARQIAQSLGARAPQDDNLDGWIAAISRSLIERDTPVTVVIDALDEASDPTAVTLSLLERLNPPGRARLKLVVGVRPSGTSALAGSGRELADVVTAALSATRLNADADEFWEQRDLADYVGQLLARGGGTANASQARVAGQIATKAGRSYLLAGLVARHLAAHGGPGLVAAQLLDALIARGIRDLVVQDLETTIADPAQRTRALLLLRAASLSFGRGIPWRTLWALVATAIAADGQTVTQGDVAWLLSQRASGYLVRDLEDGVVVYRPFHDHLGTELASGGLEDLDIATAHRRIAAALATMTRWDGYGD